MPDLKNLEKEIKKIKERNKKVEINKAWETSFSRRILLFLLTYLIAGFTFAKIQNPDPWKNALIPSLGFYLSTLTIPTAKKIWMKYIYSS